MKHLRRAGSNVRLLTMAITVALCGGGFAQAQVLDQVPSDALAVMKVNHLQDTSAKVGELMQALGVVDFAPPMADPLGALQGKLGLANGLEKTGEAAVVLENGDWTNTGHADKPPMLILLPVSDYKSFLGNLTVSATEGDISTAKFKDEPEDVFVTNWGAYAVLSPTKDALAKKPDGLKVAGMAAKQLAEKDAVIYVNFPALKGVLLPKLQSNRDIWIAKAKEAVTREGGGANGELLGTLVGELVDAGEALLNDTQAVTIGVTVDKKGVNTTTLAEFNPDSYMGKLALASKGTDGPLLTGLPSSKYLFYLGDKHDPKLGLQLYNDIVAPFEKPLADMGDQGKPIQDAIASYREAFASVEGYSAGMVAPSGPVGQGALFQFIAVYKGDAEKLKAAQEKQMQAQADLMKAFGVKSGSWMKSNVTPNAKTLGGVSFDEIKTAITMPGNNPGAAQANQMINIMYGPGGLTMLSGVIDPKTLVFASGVGDDLLTAAVASAKDGTNPMGETDAVKLVDAELPKNRSFVAYVPLDVIVSTAVGYAQQFGFPLPVQLPPNLPPIGMSLGSDGSAMRMDSHIPTQLVQSLVQAGMQFYLQHGGQPAGGGGL